MMMQCWWSQCKRWDVQDDNDEIVSDDGDDLDDRWDNFCSEGSAMHDEFSFQSADLANHLNPSQYVNIWRKEEIYEKKYLH